jgi:hypothetical protein
MVPVIASWSAWRDLEELPPEERWCPECSSRLREEEEECDDSSGRLELPLFLLRREVEPVRVYSHLLLALRHLSQPALSPVHLSFLLWQRSQAWCWLDRAVMGSKARWTDKTSSVSGSYFQVLNMMNVVLSE